MLSSYVNFINCLSKELYSWFFFSSFSKPKIQFRVCIAFHCHVSLVSFSSRTIPQSVTFFVFICLWHFEQSRQSFCNYSSILICSIVSSWLCSGHRFLVWNATYALLCPSQHISQGAHFKSYLIEKKYELLFYVAMLLIWYTVRFFCFYLHWIWGLSILYYLTII